MAHDGQSQEKTQKTIGVVGLTECGACSRMLVENAQKIIEALEREGVRIVYGQYSDENPLENELDLLVVYGSVSTTRDIELLQEATGRTGKILAIGTCALYGGTLALRNTTNPDNVLALSFLDQDIVEDPDVPIGEGAPRLASRVETATRRAQREGLLPGCPPDPEELVNAIKTMLKGGTVKPPKKNVCRDCPFSPLKSDEKTCLIEKGVLCMGLVTATGCGALCPSMGLACTGCNGPPEKTGAPWLAAIDAISSKKKSLTEWNEPDLALLYLHSLGLFRKEGSEGGTR